MIIYKATNKLNGKVYVGQTCKTLAQRIKQHHKSSQHPRSVFHKALAKYGVLGFDWTVLQEGIDSKEELDQLEVAYQKQHRCVEEGYNMVYMGSGGLNQEAMRVNRQKRGKVWEDIYSEVGLDVMRKSVIPNLIEQGAQYRFNVIPSDTQKRYASLGGKSHLGKKESDQTRKHISEGLKASAKFQQMKQDPAYRAQTAATSKANWSNPSSTYNSVDYRKKLSQAKRARFERNWIEVRPTLERLLSLNTPKVELCNRLGVSYPTMLKYVKLLQQQCATQA